MTKSKTLAGLVLVAGSVLLGGCRTNAQTGSLFGAGLGAALGGVIGHNDNGHRNAGMVIGAGAGALAGYALGNEADKEQRGTRYGGDPRYELGYRGGRRPVDVDDGPAYDDGSGRERVIYRERTIYEGDDCRECR